MKISDKGLDLIRSFEGCELSAYKCPAGVWTIGVGSTGPHVKPGMTITQEEADALLRKDVERFDRAVQKLAPTATQGQHDAMTSFAFNVGITALEGSTLLKMHRAGNYEAAAGQFRRWNRGGGRVLAGLTRRRAAEAEMYMS